MSPRRTHCVCSVQLLLKRGLESSSTGRFPTSSLLFPSVFSPTHPSVEGKEKQGAKKSMTKRGNLSWLPSPPLCLQNFFVFCFWNYFFGSILIFLTMCDDVWRHVTSCTVRSEYLSLCDGYEEGENIDNPTRGTGRYSPWKRNGKKPRPEIQDSFKDFSHRSLFFFGATRHSLPF